MKQSNLKISELSSKQDVFASIYDDSFVSSVTSYLNENKVDVRSKYSKLLALFFSSLTKQILESKISLNKLISDIYESERAQKLKYINSMSMYSDRGTLYLQKIYNSTLAENIKFFSYETKLSEETVFSLVAIVLSYAIDRIMNDYNSHDKEFGILSELITISLKSKYLDEDGYGQLESTTHKSVLAYYPNIFVGLVLVVTVFYYIKLNTFFVQNHENDILGDSPVDESIMVLQGKSKVVDRVIFSNQ